jgi:hypothetical protein
VSNTPQDPNDKQSVSSPQRDEDEPAAQDVVAAPSPDPSSEEADVPEQREEGGAAELRSLSSAEGEPSVEAQARPNVSRAELLDGRPEPPSDDALTRAYPAKPVLLPVGALGALILLIVVVTAVLLQEKQKRAVPLEDWEAAADVIREQAREGDIVRVEPVWADDPRVLLNTLRYDLTQQPMREVLDGYGRVWVMAGFNRAEKVHAQMPSEYVLVEAEQYGMVDLLLYEIPAELRPKFDFLEALPQAQVRRVGLRGTQVCSLWAENAWHCQRVDKFLNVGVRLREMGDDPRRCIYAPPIPDGGTLEIDFPDVTLGTRIEGRAGMDNWAIRSDRGSDTTFEVQLDGESATSLRIGKHDREFFPFSIDTSARAGEKAKVSFRIHADDFFDRFLCFTARIPAP